MAEPATFNFRLDVPFSPRWTHVELLRTSILNCLSTIFQDYEFCEGLSMATAELLENAVEYGAWGTDRRHPFRLRVTGDKTHVSVEVVNPIHRDGGDVRQLLATIERIRNVASPRDAYLARLEELSSGPPAADGRESRLGLLRIAFETGSVLSADLLDDGDSVLVRATLPAQRVWPDVGEATP